MDKFKILLATDGSEEVRAASQVIRALALPEGSEIRVLCVVDVPRGFFPGAHVDGRILNLLLDQERSKAHRVAERTARSVARQGIVVKSLVRRGNPAEEILEAAEDCEADLVVVGSKGLTGLTGFLLGSVARGVALACDRPVLVGRAPRKELREVLVATDGSEHASRAVEFAARLPLPQGAQMTVVHVVRGITLLEESSVSGDEEHRSAIAQLSAEQKQQGNEILAGAVRHLAESGRPAAPRAAWTGELRVGDPADEILRLVREREADLVVAGARGVSFLEKLLVGSVADRLLKHAPCSVLIVH